MKRICSIILGLFSLLLVCCSQEQTSQSNDTEHAQDSNPSKTLNLPQPREGVVEDRFALLALTCVHQKYPNKISVVLEKDDDAQTPDKLFPAFYGCFDWHSSVHGHWLLARILNTDPSTPMRNAILDALNVSLTPENIAGEVQYFKNNGAGAFERPYGRAWLLQLVAELQQSQDPAMATWREILRPLENEIVEQTESWLNKLAYPIRSGTHNQTSFSFGLMIDYARIVGNTQFESTLKESALKFHIGDENCPLAYEPSGEDFLSPCLMEADLMRRILSQKEFSNWLTNFLPNIPSDGNGEWLKIGLVLDATDGKLVHLDGVNLSRAWALEGIASALPSDDVRIASLVSASILHKEKGIAAVSSEHYAGSHWLGSFATYLTTKRGLAVEQNAQ